MAKKKESGKAHNKVASVLLVVVGLFFTCLPLTVNYMYYEYKILMFAGIVMLVLGGILLNKSFFK
tara:strand:- start:230 stop:424 length:195 start_codon:yes stop_codon:yes gene_type:complete